MSAGVTDISHDKKGGDAGRGRPASPVRCVALTGVRASQRIRHPLLRGNPLYEKHTGDFNHFVMRDRPAFRFNFFSVCRNDVSTPLLCSVPRTFAHRTLFLDKCTVWQPDLQRIFSLCQALFFVCLTRLFSVTYEFIAARYTPVAALFLKPGPPKDE
jgi:hypothetical protein